VRTVILWMILLASGSDAPRAHAAEGDWPWWRGPLRNGVAAADQDPPLRWSATENVVWKTPIPGRGHGSPIVVGERVYLATADEARESRSVLCLDRATGRVVWSTPVHQDRPTPPRNEKGTQASSTVACDGERLFINFLHDGGMYTSALGLDGQLLWQQRVSDYVVHQGYGSSPAVYGPLVIVSADNKSGGAIAGLDRATGQIVWRHDRPKTPNYPSPVVLEVAGRTQLLMTGCNLVAGFDPLTGERLWEIPGATTECVTSTVTDGERIYTSGGYPRNHVAAIEADGSGKIAWENATRVYVPSMLVHASHLFAVADAGFAVCWDAATGVERWKGRLGGTFSSSPVLVGDRVYVTNEAGQTYIFRADPERFELLGENALGNECFATPAICGGRIYTRVAERDGETRQEFLYCLGAKE
jgi:outer membrane protein assembly factor BamB